MEFLLRENRDEEILPFCFVSSFAATVAISRFFFHVLFCSPALLGHEGLSVSGGGESIGLHIEAELADTF